MRPPPTLSAEQVIRLAYLTGCERVDRLGDAMIEVLESGVASKVPVDLADELRTVLGAPARTTWPELLQHAGALSNASPALSFRKLAFRIREGKAPTHPEICPAEHPGTNAITRCSLLRGHEGPHMSLAADLTWDREAEAPKATRLCKASGYVEGAIRACTRDLDHEGDHHDEAAGFSWPQEHAPLMFGRIADKKTREALDTLNRAIGSLHGQVDDLARTAREADLGISKRLDDFVLASHSHAKEVADFATAERERVDNLVLDRTDLRKRTTDLEQAQDSLEQRLLAEIDRRFNAFLGPDVAGQIAKVFAGMKTQNERLAAQDEKLRDGLSRVSGHAAQLERLEGWRTRVSKQYGPEAQDLAVRVAHRRRDEAIASASSDVLASASEVFKKLEQGLLSLDRDVVSTNKRIDEALVKGKERGDEIRGRLSEIEARIDAPIQLGEVPTNYRVATVSPCDLVAPPPVALEPLSADELARAKSVDGSGPSGLCLLTSLVHGETATCMRRAGHAGEHIDRNVVWFEPAAEKTYATYTPTGPLDVEAGTGLAKSLSKSVMASSGTELLDLASLRVPTLETDGTAVLIAEDGRLVIANENGENVGVAQLAPPMRRLLARMLEQSAAEEEEARS